MTLLLKLSIRQVSVVVSVLVLVRITKFKCKAQTQKPKRAHRCGLYMAESTIPGAGIGMFVGHTSFEPGEVVNDSDLVVPVFELERHQFRHFDLLLDDYVWSPWTFPLMFQGLDDQEVDVTDKNFAFSPGVGAVPNFRSNLVNVDDAKHSTFTMGMSGVLSESPGAGAFTPYYGRQLQASRPIPPGMELSLNYEDDYFISRSDDYPTMPSKEDYVVADDLLRVFTVLKQRIAALRNPGTNVSEALYQLIVDDFPYKSRPMYAMPSNASIIDHVLMTGGTANTAYNESIRSLEWLEEHGSCVDNVKDGVSTIPHAGRGAFANRFIPQGGLAAPMPLIHIPNRSILNRYKNSIDQTNEQGYTARDTSQPMHRQLLLNYCFGHKETTLLLCPYGVLTSSINHSHDQPNAKLEWSKNLRHPEWLNQVHFAWDHINHPGLSFDVIALRDIEEDEEILIDYGIEWETAWREHVANFDPPRRNYTPAFEMNQQVDLQIKTTFEADYETIDGIFTYCRKHIVDMALGQKDALIGEKDMWIEVEDVEDEGCYPCRVVHRNHNDSYIAELFSRVQRRKGHPSGMWKITVDIVKYVLFDVPRDTFYFHDNYFHRDHHQEWSFRHDMRIPDDIFPDAWRKAHSTKQNTGLLETDDVDDNCYSTEETIGHCGRQTRRRNF